jgi:hypothetical protein
LPLSVHRELLKVFEDTLGPLGVFIIRQVAGVDNTDPELIQVAPVAADRSLGARRVPRATKSLTKLSLNQVRERRVLLEFPDCCLIEALVDQ